MPRVFKNNKENKTIIYYTNNSDEDYWITEAGTP